MPALLQICIVIVTIGLVAIALTMVRMMTRFNRATEELSQLTHSVRESAVKFDLVTYEARELLASLRDCVPPVLRVVDRFEDIGQRTADLSTTLLEEIELPVFTAAAVARGVKSGAHHLLKRLMHRYTHRHSPNNGDHDHERHFE
jgi:uncharacterized protein YoxC